MNRRALVIGGRRGIGAAVVQALAAQGMAVTYTYRTAPGDAAATSRQLDLADRSAVDAFALEQEDAPAWDAVVHVGGTTYDTLAAVMDQDAAEQTMQVNYWAFARIARAVVRPMLRARYGPYRCDRLGDGAARKPGQRLLCGEQGRTAVLCAHTGDRNRQARRHGELHSAWLRRYRDAGAVSRHTVPPSRAASPPAASPNRRRSPRWSHSWPRRPPATSTAPTSR